LIGLAFTGERATVRVAAATGASRAVTLRAADLALLRCAARSRRGQLALPAPGTGYQGLLRALGQVVDDRSGRACELRADGRGLVARVLVGDGEATAWRTLRLARERRDATMRAD
jgi:hypothetical protein